MVRTSDSWGDHWGDPRTSGPRNQPSPKASDGVASALSAPSIQPPKGSRPIRGIGEKVSTMPLTGTATVSVPILTSLGRSGFQPALTLTYDSGVGNGPFGLGWQLSLPAIT